MEGLGSYNFVVVLSPPLRVGRGEGNREGEFPESSLSAFRLGNVFATQLITLTEAIPSDPRKQARNFQRFPPPARYKK